MAHAHDPILPGRDFAMCAFRAKPNISDRAYGGMTYEAGDIFIEGPPPKEREASRDRAACAILRSIVVLPEMMDFGPHRGIIEYQSYTEEEKRGGRSGC